MTGLARRALALVVGVALMLGVPATAWAVPCKGFSCNTQKSGIDVYGVQKLHQMATEQAKAMAARTPYFEYRTVNSCSSGGSKFRTEDCLTNQVTTFCPGEDGPLVDILRRLIPVTGTPGAWELTGLTCLANEVPGANKQPTMAMIVNAFHQTTWAKATLGFQPKGNRTLVNLPSYYAANWTTEGFGPGEVDALDPATMFGHPVKVRPKLVSFTYHFGDGTSFGPTKSVGGKYPTGDVQHVYKKPGTFSAYVTVVWGADVQIDGGPWQEIPATATVNQPAQNIQVLTAKTRLVR